MTKRQFQPGRGYTKKDWDAVDFPDATETELATARPFAEAFPELAESIRREREAPAGRTVVSVPLDNDLLEKLEASGPGWRMRINDMLLDVLERPAAAKRG